MAKRERDPEAKRAAILEAARKILREGGYFTQFSLEKVAAEAGVSKGGLLHHFPSKEALLKGVGEDTVARFEERVKDGLAEVGQADGRFTHAYIQAALVDNEAARDVSPVLLAFLYKDQEVEDNLRFNFWQEFSEGDAEDVILATILRLAVDGLLYTEVIAGTPIESGLRERIIERLYKMAETMSNEQ